MSDKRREQRSIADRSRDHRQERHHAGRSANHSAAGRVCLFAITLALVSPGSTAAQMAGDELRILRLEATPIGALPPVPLPMPASRNHNYWGFRVQAGQRRGRGGPDLSSIAGSIDWQLRGGSVFSVTGGLQRRACETQDDDCGGHALFGARGRFGLITGGPSLGALFGDNSATAVVGLEVGFGFAPDVSPDVNACTVDWGAPVSLSMLQRIRLVTFVAPALVWNVDCSRGGAPSDVSFLTGLGIGVQQLGLRGLDVSIGLQKIFESGAGYQLGLSVSYIRVR